MISDTAKEVVELSEELVVVELDSFFAHPATSNRDVVIRMKHVRQSLSFFFMNILD